MKKKIGSLLIAFIAYADYPVYLTDKAKVSALVDYKGKRFGFTMPKKGKAIVAPAN